MTTVDTKRAKRHANEDINNIRYTGREERVLWQEGTGRDTDVIWHTRAQIEDATVASGYMYKIRKMRC